MIITPGQVLRLLTIQRVLIRHGLDEIILATHLFRPLRFLMYVLPWNWVREVRGTKGERIRRALEDLGPVFVKLGQILSTRRDLLPDDIAAELSNLQDAVPPFPGRIARQMIEVAYGKPLTEVFAEFSEEPLASASIAQVHAATLHDGRQVIAKVVRPGIEKIIRRDVGLMHILAAMAERYSEQGRQLQPSGVVDEFERIIFDELDMMREAANASQLRRNFHGAKNIYIPEITWDLTRRNVMIMERVLGIPISDHAALVRAGVDLKGLAEAGVEVFFTQVFRDHYFHADMHPGNLFVAPAKDGLPDRFIPVDFGIMGSLSDFDQRYLAENFMAFMNRDYRRVAELHIESAWVPADTRVDEFESAVRTVCEPMFERPIKLISFGEMLIRLFQTAQRFQMKILPQMLLLQKTLVNIEGLGRQLCPELDLWGTARPTLERWMRERLGIRRVAHVTKANLPVWGERLPQLPGLAFQVLDQVRHGSIQVQNHPQDLMKLRQEIRLANQRTVLTIVGTGFLLSASILVAAGINPNVQQWRSIITAAFAFLGLGLLLFAFVRREA